MSNTSEMPRWVWMQPASDASKLPFYALIWKGQFSEIPKHIDGKSPPTKYVRIDVAGEMATNVMAAYTTVMQQLKATVDRVQAENDKLRGMLANSPLDCVYCGLPAADQNKCASGFPGCSRGDDQMAVLDTSELEIPDVPVEPDALDEFE